MGNQRRPRLPLLVVLFPWLIAALLLPQPPLWCAALPADIRAEAFGFRADAAGDDTAALQAAIDWAVARPGSRVLLPTGRIDLNGSMRINDCRSFALMGTGTDTTLLVNHAPDSTFSYSGCDGLRLAALSIDYWPLPFTGGYVVNVSTAEPWSIDVRIVPPHTADVSRAASAIHRYDPLLQRPSAGSDALEVFQ